MKMCNKLNSQWTRHAISSSPKNETFLNKFFHEWCQKKRLSNFSRRLVKMKKFFFYFTSWPRARIIEQLLHDRTLYPVSSFSRERKSLGVIFSLGSLLTYLLTLAVAPIFKLQKYWPVPNVKNIFFCWNVHQ